MNYHIPVLLRQSIDGLIWRKDGIYIDATMGGGGHSRAILQQLDDNGHLFAFDQDEDARSNLPQDKRCTFIPANFRYLGQFMEYYGVGHVSGILADLGVSSWQFDTMERGFSHRGDAILDMRMAKGQQLTAEVLVNDLSAEQLQDVLGRYGEVRNAKTLARAIVERRSVTPVRTTGDLISICEPYIRGNRNRYLSQVFQALRIAVNEEMEALEELLLSSGRLLEKGGRLVVLSYHSLEDRMVKLYMKSGNPEGEVRKDAFGKIEKMFHVLTPKPLMADEEEIKQNPRARSVRLRVAEKK